MNCRRSACDRFVGQSVDGEHEVVFGGPLLAHAVVAAAKSQAGKNAKTVHTVFARGGQTSEPVDIRGGTMHGPDLRQRGGDQGRRQSYRLLLYIYIYESNEVSPWGMMFTVRIGQTT